MKGAFDMKNRLWIRRIGVVITAAAIPAGAFPNAVQTYAENRQFITDIRLEVGDDAADVLEENGYQVSLVGLNAASEAGSQIYLGLRFNEGEPVTNIIISPDVGDTLTDGSGIVYECASHTDVDEGVGGGAGCIYVTRSKDAGAPLVGLDVLRSDAEKGEEMYAITNDGAEIVRTPDGAPADLEKNSDTMTCYLAQIRDGIVRPYISEIGVVTDTDKWNAVYTACERGYDYYADGDLDDSADTYTIIAYKRTADLSDAVTCIAAIDENTVNELEKAQIIDDISVPSADETDADSESTDSDEADQAQTSDELTAAAVGISGCEYIRVSSRPIAAGQPYYLYQTKESSAGNPVSMIYSEETAETSEFLFNTWASAYFFTNSRTSAYVYCMNEDLYSELQSDMSVLIKQPVRLVDSFAPVREDQPVVTAPAETASSTSEAVTEPSDDSAGEDISEPETGLTDEEASAPAADTGADIAEENTSETAEVTEATEAATETETEADVPVTEAVPAENDAVSKTVRITMLTKKEGLPNGGTELNGIRLDAIQPPVIERTERSDRVNKLPASVFGERGLFAIVLGGAAIAAAAVSAGIILKKSPSKEKDKKKKRKQR